MDALLRMQAALDLAARHGRLAVTEAIRADLAAARSAGLAIDADGLFQRIAARLEAASAPSLRRVFNLTGTVLHTNLGRAVLAEAAMQAVDTAMRHFTTVEFDLASGQRGERDDHLRGLVRELTGAEDVCLVNNNAAAVLLVLNTLSRGRETIVSRGELIEIGGSFRIPGIMRAAGAKLREVGATNRTHLSDYEDAVSARTALLMKAHPSNYRIEGFAAEVPAREIAALAKARNLPFIDDLGSGTLVDLSRFGLPRERLVQDAIGDGADIVTFSGDKLLGGPQAGFIAGRKDLVRACARNQLKRSLRLDKLRIAALEATLKLYRDPDRLAERIPALRFFAKTRASLEALARTLAPLLQSALGEHWRVAAAPCSSQIGSGALPMETMPGFGLACAPLAKRKGAALDDLAARLRALPIPVIGRISRNALLLDLRCLDDEAAFTAGLATLRNPE